MSPHTGYTFTPWVVSPEWIHHLAPPTAHREFVALWVCTVPMAQNGKFSVIRQHIRTLNTLLLKHISHAQRRTTTFPPIPPSEPYWFSATPVTSYTRIHRVGIGRVELGGYIFGSLEWIHGLAPSNAHREFGGILAKLICSAKRAFTSRKVAFFIDISIYHRSSHH